MNYQPPPPPPQSNEQFDDSYARLNNQYGPVSQDVRNSYPQNDDFAADLNPLLEKKKSKHIRSLIASLILIAGEGAILPLYFTNVIYLELGALIGICVGIYVFYLLLGLCCNPLLQYLGNVEHGANFQNEYNKVRSIIGYFRFHAQCYHYETRYHTRTVTNSDGSTRTQTYTTQQKVVTHTATENISPRETFDDSGSVDQVRALTNIIFIHFITSYRFKDEGSRYYFEKQWEYFRNRNHRDIHQDYSYTYVMPGLKERMTFYIGDEPEKYRCRLIVASIFGCIWPVSMAIEDKVSRYNINIMKILTF